MTELVPVVGFRKADGSVYVFDPSLGEPNVFLSNNDLSFRDDDMRLDDVVDLLVEHEQLFRIEKRTHD